MRLFRTMTSARRSFLAMSKLDRAKLIMEYSAQRSDDFIERLDKDFEGCSTPVKLINSSFILSESILGEKHWKEIIKKYEQRS